MGFWASFYFLKSVTKLSDIWDCIKNTFTDMKYKESLPTEMPNHFCLISERDYFCWDCSSSDDGIVEFEFNGTLAEREISLLIIFDKQKSLLRAKRFTCWLTRKKRKEACFFIVVFFKSLNTIFLTNTQRLMSYLTNMEKKLLRQRVLAQIMNREKFLFTFCLMTRTKDYLFLMNGLKSYGKIYGLLALNF